MVVNEKALVREMKEAYKGVGYTVMVMPGDRWVFMHGENWIVEIEGQDNVPREALALMVLHMGYLPRLQSCSRVYKAEKCTVIQKEVYAVAEDDYQKLMERIQDTDREEVRRTSLVYGRRRVWQQIENKGILLIDPKFESLLEVTGDSIIRRVGESVYLEGEISRVFISRSRGGANESLLEHLAQVKWT